MEQKGGVEVRIDRRSGRIYLLIHAVLLVAVLLFPLYRYVAEGITSVLSGCFLHDRLFLYCPLCGGTRAVAALLRLDLFGAFRYNAFVTLVLFLAIVLDLWALVRLLKGRSRLLPLPGWFWIFLSVAMVLYAVLRNDLMITHGIDPVGDLSFFWSRIK